MMLFFCKSRATTPSGGSQVDIADICWGGGLIQLVEAFSAGPPLCLLVLLLLLPALTEAAQQHTFNLLLALFENILQCDERHAVNNTRILTYEKPAGFFFATLNQFSRMLNRFRVRI